jgi:hypothetical protein
MTVSRLAIGAHAACNGAASASFHRREPAYAADTVCQQQANSRIHRPDGDREKNRFFSHHAGATKRAALSESAKDPTRWVIEPFAMGAIAEPRGNSRRNDQSVLTLLLPSYRYWE